MALATDSNGRHLSAEPAPVAFSMGMDRSRAFALARRHSFVVRWLKIFLPICAVVVLSSYVVFMQRSLEVEGGKLELGPVAFSSDVLTMHDPRYEGYGKDGTRFAVAARTAEQDIQREGPIRLNTIEGTIVQPNKMTTKLLATKGVFDSEANELELLDSIEIKSSDGMTARLTRAKVSMKESKIVSNEPVTVEMATGTLAGNSMVLLQKSRELTFTGGVNARLKPQGKPGTAGKADQPQSMTNLIGSGDAPVDVTAPTLTVNDEQKTAVFSGNVRVEQDGSVLTARELQILYDGAGPGTEADNGPAVPGTAASGRVKRIFAYDDVVITRGTDRVTSAAAEFDTAAETSILTGGVTFNSGSDQRAVADRADLDFKAETVLLTGSAVAVSQGPNTLDGRRLFVDRKNGTMQLSSPAVEGTPAGRIEAKFQQPNPKPTRTQASADGESGGLRFRTDPNAPIEIDADVLDVDDKVRTATFRGDVVVVQGDFRIRTVELVATYAGQAGAQLMQPGDPNAKKPAAQLQRVRARRKVVVTSKGDQSASGDWADFDVKANTVVLGGDVTLTQGRNVIRGPRLVIDMTTGLSRMETRGLTGTPTAGAQPGGTTSDAQGATRGGKAPTAKGWPAGACGGRMCAVFYPEDAKAFAKRRKAENAPSRPQGAQPQTGEAASSWTSTTTPAGVPE